MVTAMDRRQETDRRHADPGTVVQCATCPNRTPTAVALGVAWTRPGRGRPDAPLWFCPACQHRVTLWWAELNRMAQDRFDNACVKS